jgi:hypothetical protein
MPTKFSRLLTNGRTAPLVIIPTSYYAASTDLFHEGGIPLYCDLGQSQFACEQCVPSASPLRVQRAITWIDRGKGWATKASPERALSHLRTATRFGDGRHAPR